MKLKIVISFIVIIVVVGASLLFYNSWRKQQAEYKQAGVHYEKGVELFRNKNYFHAIQELRKALKGNRKDWKAPFYIASSLVKMKSYDRAIPFLEHALSVNPKETKILKAFGVVYFKLGRLDMAKGYFSASLSIDPTDRSAQGLMESMALLQWRAREASAPKED